MDEYKAAAFAGMARNPALTCMSRLTVALKLLDHYEKQLGIDWEAELTR